MPVTILKERLLGTQTLRCTVLFADLRGYTTLAERLNPAAVVALLDEFFSMVAQAVESHGGTIFHLAGDSAMAGFGLADPGAGASRAAAEANRAAINASRQMVAAFAQIAARWTSRFGVATGIGVGLHVGDLACAEIGPAAVRRRTLIGDTVNVAARLCERARAGEVLFSAGIAKGLGAALSTAMIALPDFTLRGREAPIAIFCIPARERLKLDPKPQDRPVEPPVAAV